uniref:Uncharacterized protein n=1 Tax=Romanomermis culicivorax TaxID=13658 RepID=A0A915LC44_ROMCU
MQLDQWPTTCHNMQTEQPNPKLTQFGADVIIILLREGGHPSKAEVKMGITYQPLQQSHWYSLCPTTITVVGSGQTILLIDEGGGPKAQAPHLLTASPGRPFRDPANFVKINPYAMPINKCQVKNINFTRNTEH